MSIITLISDFGNVDYRVPAIKGQILQQNVNSKIVDISHEINSFDLQQAAYVLKNTYPYFPKGSVHIIAIDSFYHKERKYIIYHADGHFFLSADNGILSLVFHNLLPTAIYEITYNQRFDDIVENAVTEILVPAAVHLNNGGIPELIGRKIENPRTLTFPKPGKQNNMIFGEIIYIDHFGNLVTNITKDFFYKNSVSYTQFEIKFRNITLKNIQDSYSAIVKNWQNESQYHGKTGAYFNEMGHLEIIIYKGNKYNGAKSLLGIQKGEKVYISYI